ncbi:MAG TPA: GTPase domain-containing protein [Candidatus Lokiarchaeia archaeon]|nr:GTPase domain-containing protein [Candidatus Lokiarchaeia archaeon]
MKKIVFLGPPNAGKTSLRKFLFEGVPADTILEENQVPTIGINYSKHNYMYTYPFENHGKIPEKIPLELVMLDTSGQELEKILSTILRNQVFSRADIIMFIFDVSEWENEARREQLMNFISSANDARLEIAPESMFHVIGHKYDIISGGIDEMEKNRVRIRNDLDNYIFQKTGKMLMLDIRVTSLQKEYRRVSFNALFELTTNILLTSL